ncbi:hypothetical protein Tco_0577498 [Tanacetum coccineum]
MDQDETYRRLTVIYDVHKIASESSVDEVVCNMLKSYTFQVVKKKKDTGKTVSNGDTVQEVEKKKDTGKSIRKWIISRGELAGVRELILYQEKFLYDAGRRNLTSGKEYGVTYNHVKRVWRPKSPVDSSKESNVTHMTTSAAGVNGKPAIYNKSHSHSLAPKSSSVTLDVMQKKLAVSSRHSVIFPDRLHVPEDCKSKFVFGSFDATIFPDRLHVPEDCKSKFVFGSFDATCPTKPSSRYSQCAVDIGSTTVNAHQNQLLEFLFIIRLATCEELLIHDDEETIEKNKVEADRQFAEIMNAIQALQPLTTLPATIPRFEEKSGESYTSSKEVKDNRFISDDVTKVADEYGGKNLPQTDSTLKDSDKNDIGTCIGVPKSTNSQEQSRILVDTEVRSGLV